MWLQARKFTANFKKQVLRALVLDIQIRLVQKNGNIYYFKLPFTLTV